MDGESVVSARSERSRHSQGSRRPSVQRLNTRLLADARESQRQHFRLKNLQRENGKPYEDDDTVVTGATSEFGYSLEDFRKCTFNNQQVKYSFNTASICFKIRSFFVSILLFFFSTACFLSPIAMVVLPKVPLVEWSVEGCGSKCESSLLALAFKLLILSLATWAIYFRSSSSFLPRLDYNKVLILFLTSFTTISFWFFYFLKLYKKTHISYLTIVNFSTSFLDLLLLLHYLGVIYLEIKRLQTRFVVKILRSPDGVSKAYTAGASSLQDLALWCLHKYYCDFQAFNPYLEMHRPSRHTPAPAFKLYNIDAEASKDAPICTKASSVASSTTQHERIVSEVEHERRTLKRRYRLVAAADEAFQHVALTRASSKKEGGGNGLLSSRETAEAIFPTLVRPLQKYLKSTRQQPKHSMQSVLEHLTLCLSYRLSHKAFLEKYLSQGEVVWAGNSPFFGRPSLESPPSKNSCQASNHNWVLTCESPVSRDVRGGMTFKLTRNTGKINHINVLEVISSTECLLVSVQALPFFDVVEEGIDLKNQRFILNMNSELCV